jgi:hypothetical protein
MIPESRIIELYHEFSRERSYKSRLSLFDKHFDIIPYSFPLFDHHLQFLDNPVLVNALKSIYQTESMYPVCLRKELLVNETNFVFDVRPVNSRPADFNQFILSKFISGDKRFNRIVAAISRTGHFEKQSVSFLLGESDRRLQSFQRRKPDKRTKEFSTQIARVFWAGFTDYRAGIIKTFRHKKKIIELYLYAQGVLYARYREALASCIRRNERLSHPVVPATGIASAPIGWSDRPVH